MIQPDHDGARGPAPLGPTVDDARRLRHLYATMAQGVVYQDASGAIVDANGAAQRLLGLTLDQMQGRTSVDPRWRAVKADGRPFPGEEHPAMVALRTGEPVHDVVMGVHHPGQDDLVWILVSATPVPGEDGSPPFVFATFTDITDRKRAEDDLLRQRRVEEMLVEVASTYIDLPESRADATIDASLARLGELVGADRFYVFAVDHERNTVTNTHEWCAPGVAPQIEVLQDWPLDDLEDWMEVHRRGETMLVRSVSALPPDHPHRQLLEPQGVESLISVPIMDEGRFVGFVGLDSVNTHRVYQDSEERLLKVFAEMLAHLRRRQRAVARLSESRQLLSDVIENSGAIVYVKDLEGRYVTVNRVWEALLGHPREAVLGETDEALFGPAVAARLAAIDARAMASPVPVETEEVMATALGTRTFLSVKFALRDHTGAATGVCGIATDITERKRVEETLRRSEQRAQDLLAGLPVGVVVADAEKGHFVFANAAFGRLVGRPPTDVVGQTPADLHPPADLPWILEDFARHARGEGVRTRDVPVLRSDGSVFRAEIGSSMGELEGRPVLFGVFTDVTERSRVEHQERARTQVLSMMAGGAALPEVLERVVAFVEEAVPGTRCTVLRADEAGRRLQVVAAPDLPAPFVAAVDGTPVAMASGASGTAAYLGETVLVDDVAVHPYWTPALRDLTLAAGVRAVWSEPVRSREGLVLGTLTAYRDAPGPPDDGSLRQLRAAADLTSLAFEQQSAAEERVRRKAAESANRAKSVFLANMSHEIRTPLNAVIGFAQLLERDASIGPRQQEQVRTIARSGEHLLRLINDILDFSKIEADRVVLEPVVFDPAALVDDIASMFAAQGRAKGVGVRVERAHHAAAHVRGDVARLRQVLINLVSNAVKFTARGEVVVRLRSAPPDDAAAIDGATLVDLAFEVADTGPGIPEDEREGIYGTFQQGAAGRHAGGTGLGLTIARRIVELMAGEISFETREGVGTTFRVVVPVEAVATPAGAEAAAGEGAWRLPASPRRLKALSVDDNAANRAVVRAMLEGAGFDVRDAENGAVALDVFGAWVPDVVLMDLRMPVMDGFEAVERLKADPVRGRTPVIAVTAGVFDGDERQAEAAGFDGFVRKPFRLEAFFEELGRVLGVTFDGPGARPTVVASAPPATARPLLERLRRLLEVDDADALEVVRAHRDELVAALGATAETLVAQVAAFDLPAALATVRRSLDAVDAPTAPPGEG